MKATIIAIGKLRDRAIRDLCDEYERRSRSFIPMERVEVRDLASAWTAAQRLGGRVVLLDERGEQLTSLALASLFAEWRDGGIRDIAFMLGDAHGFSDKDRAEADRLLGLSRLTLPHRLAQLLLCEQIYRAGTVLAGHPYHHGA